jgi:hypothetical protein
MTTSAVGASAASTPTSRSGARGRCGSVATERMRRHWWWRPGWRPGRRLYAWHLTFGDQTVSRGQADLRRVVGDYQARLAELPGLDLVPAEWLHLTMQSIGFADEGRHRRRRADRGRGSPSLRRTGVGEVDARPGGAPSRGHLAAGGSNGVGPASAGGGPSRHRRGVGAGVRPRGGRRLHAARIASLQRHRRAGRAVRHRPGRDGTRSATVKLDAVQAISLGRDTHIYRWETIATVRLGTGAIRGNHAPPVRGN